MLILWTRLCALHVINAPAWVAGRDSWFRFQDGHTRVGLLLKRARRPGPFAGPRFFVLNKERAMPMLIWLPMIFMSVLLEMNGFAPQGQANNDPLPS